MPYFSDSGEMRDPDLYADVADHAAPALPSRIGLGPEPKAPAPKDAPAADAPLKPGWPVLDTLEQVEAFRAGIPGDPYHPALSDPELMEYAVLQEWRLSGQAGEPDALGTLFDAKILRPEDHPPVRIPTLSEDARAAFGLDPAEAGAVIEHQEALVDLADQSAIPRYHVESLIQDVGAAMEDLARDDDTDTPEAGSAELVRLEGAGRARQIVADAQQLVQVLHASGQTNLVAAAEDLIATSNHPRVLIGAARLYQELKNLPPQGPWEQLLLAAGARWAQGQAAAKARAAKAAQADETPEDRIVSTGGRP